MRKVLIIEDDPTMVSLLETLLKLENFQPLTAPPEEDVLEVIRKHKPDVVLMDIHLRGQVNGLEIVRRIRQMTDLQDTRVILISGMQMQSESLDAGADDFVLKPYMPNDLIQRIHKVIGG